MRVLHIGKYFPPFAGGIENFQFDLMAACSALGIESAALVHDHCRGMHTRQDSFPMERGNDLRITRAPTWGRLLYAPVSPAFGLVMQRILNDLAPDVLHVHMPNLSAFWLLLNRRLSVPIIVHWHADVLTEGVSMTLAAAYRAYRPFEQALLARADRIIATSHAYLDASPALRNWKAKCVIVPLGLAPERLSAVPRDVHLPSWKESDALKLIIVGRLTAYKGHLNLVEAVHRVPGVELMIVGEGEEKARIQAAAQAGPRRSSIRLAGFLDDPSRNRLIMDSDLLCLTSLDRGEAFGLVLIEAMGLGKPALVTDIPGSGVSHLVEKDVTGFKVPPGNVEALAAHLTMARNMRHRLGDMGRAARSRFEREFHIEPVANQIVGLYRELLH